MQHLLPVSRYRNGQTKDAIGMRVCTLIVLTGLAISMMSGCNHEETFIPLIDTQSPRDPDTAKIILPYTVGQKIRYEFVCMLCSFCLDTCPYRDTLELEVIGQAGDTFFIREEITPASTIRTMEFAYNNFLIQHIRPDEIDTNRWFVQNDDLMLEGVSRTTQSHLLHRLNLPIRDIPWPKVELEGYYTTLGHHEKDKQAYTLNAVINAQEYSRLNIFMNNSHHALDGPGNTTYYSRLHGIVRTTYYEYVGPGRYVWDKL